MAKNIEAVVLSAGLSSRMGGFKPLYPLGGSTVIEQTVSGFLQAGVERVHVVVGHRADELLPVIAALGARAVRNDAYASGMFSSVQAGVRAVSASADAFFLTPVDIPLVRTQTIAALRDAYNPDKAVILHPCFLGKRGHPPLLGAPLRRPILESDGEGGLRAVLDRWEREHPENVRQLETADQGILLDMDRKEQYARLFERAQQLGLPTREECQALMEKAGTPQRARKHGEAVAKVAVALGRLYNELPKQLPSQLPGTNGKLDLERIERAALVHDLAKGKPKHEELGGEILEAAGFTDIASIVALHRDLPDPESAPITERVLMFMADKFVAGTRVVSLDDRYGQALEYYGHIEKARLAIEGRRARARLLAQRIEQETGRNVQALAAEALQ